jgi:hypothetical protein
MAATRLRRDRVSTCRLYRLSGSIRLSDGAILLFDVGSASLTDDHALVSGRPRISAFDKQYVVPLRLGSGRCPDAAQDFSGVFSKKGGLRPWLPAW